MRPFAECRDSRQCFAHVWGKCKILTETYEDGKCPFCKPERDMTKGKHYPYRQFGAISYDFEIEEEEDE